MLGNELLGLWRCRSSLCGIALANQMVHSSTVPQCFAHLRFRPLCPNPFFSIWIPYSNLSALVALMLGNTRHDVARHWSDCLSQASTHKHAQHHCSKASQP